MSITRRNTSFKRILAVHFWFVPCINVQNFPKFICNSAFICRDRVRIAHRSLGLGSYETPAMSRTITSDVIEQFKDTGLSDGVRTATVNRDLAVLRRMMKLAERKRLINESPFRDVDFLEEHKQRRRPHILTFEEQEQLLAAARPHIRALAVLILETGMRSNREALALSWADVDFVNNVIRVRESKTEAGRRNIPISDRCKVELLRWRKLLGPDFSTYVFPKHEQPFEAAQGCSKELSKTNIKRSSEHRSRGTTRVFTSSPLPRRAPVGLVSCRCSRH